MSNPNFDIIASTTLENYASTMIDNVFTARPLFHFLNQSGQIQMESGGRKIVKPLMTGLNTSFGSYATVDTINIDPQDGITSAEFDWKQVAVSINVNGLEIAENSGEAQLINLLQAKIKQAEETMKEKLDEMLLGDGTGNSGKDLDGLAHMVAQNATAVGGIDPSTSAYWEANLTTTAGALTVALMRNKYNSISRGNDQPDFILTEQAAYEKYEDLLSPQLRYTDPGTADAGFTNLVFRGIPVVYDGYVAAGEMFFINATYLYLIGHSNVWFSPTPFERPTDQDIKVAQILSYGNMATDNRAAQGHFSGLTYA